ncbi:MAG: CPBP family intramembrane metalloprotease [Acidobacteria bacterium]|nr:CPBP family intramembrane metalloprotease [Acidobacteriota bacterium]
MISTLAEMLFALLLAVGVPALAYVTARRPDLRSIPRRALYLSAVISQWILALLGGLVVLVTGRGFAAAGFRDLPAESFLRWTLLIALVGLVALAIWLLLEHLGWWPAESDLVRLLLPETNREKLWAVLLVAPTAAFCEEFVYRGILLAQLSDWLNSGVWALVISSVIFALAHVYQGPSGMVRVALLGALLAYPVLLQGSLYPSMAAHFVIDAVALAWLGPRFVEREAA